MLKCSWCRAAQVRPGQTYCGRKCRQAAWRQRRAGGVPAEASLSADEARAATPLVFEYADPPYPGFASLYKDQESYGGEVDHAALVARLLGELDAGRLAGFALSTSSKTLGLVLRLFPAALVDDPTRMRIGAWVKPIGVSGETKGPHSTWEPLLVVGGRRMRPGFRDWNEDEESSGAPSDALRTPPARQGGADLIGRKPQLFCAWLFDMLGMVPGDSLIDTFPGSGIVSRAWAELSSRAARQLSLSLDAGEGRRVVLSSMDQGATQ